MNTTRIDTPNIPKRTVMYAFVFCFMALLVDGADLIMLSYTYTSLRAEFGLSQTAVGALGTFTLAGMTIGGLFGGWASDRFGRVNTIAWSIAIFSVGTAALGLSPNYWTFALLRLLSATGLGAVFLACNTLMSEYVPQKRRTLILSTLQVGWTIGYIVATVLAGWIIPSYGWRYLFFLAIIPVILALLMKRLVPESPIWLAARAERERLEAAGMSITKAAKPVSGSYWRRLRDDKAVFPIFIFWLLTTGFFQFGYYGVNNWMPSYLETELGMNFKLLTGYLVGTYVAAIIGKLLAGVSADYIGTRTVYAFGALGTAAFIPIIIFYHTPDNIQALLIVFGILYGIPAGVLGTYMTESFPVAIRGYAMGTAYNVGRIGAAMAPIVIGFVAGAMGIGISFLILGLAYLVTGLVPALKIKSKIYNTNKE